MRKSIFFGIFLICLALDIISKYYFERILSIEPYIPLFGDILSLKLSYNTGIAFSLPLTGLWLQVVTVGLIIAIVYYYIREEYQKNSLLLDSAYTLILAGALSHAYERIFIGHVVDFIAVKYFAILNFADIFISIGVFLLILSYVRTEYTRKS